MTPPYPRPRFRSLQHVNTATGRPLGTARDATAPPGVSTSHGQYFVPILDGMNETPRRQLSPWVRRALAGRLPVSYAGGTEVSREEQSIGVNAVESRTPVFFDAPARWESVQVHPDDGLEQCSCGEIHRGWRHRDPVTAE